jgi:hypothetical protein
MADEFDNAINSFDRRDEHLRWIEYKGSIKWYRLKDLALTCAGHRCQHVSDKGARCGARKHLDMHHLYYPVDSDKDCLDNVIILCRKHHEDVGGFAND